MNEWGFASEITKWWEEAFRRNPLWNLRAARVEEVVPGSRQRSDIVVLGQGAILCGEIRLPDHPQSEPWHLDNLQDAIQKATTRGCRWAFTSDGNTLLLIDTELPGQPVTRVVHRLELEHFEKRAALESAAFLEAVKRRWISAFEELAPIVCGQASPPGMAPDELFVNALRALLSAPVATIRDALNNRRADKRFESLLIIWMVDDQGWPHDPENWEAEVQLAAKLTAYVFATRLLFYSALRRSQLSLRKLVLPTGTSASVAAVTLRAQFEEAQKVSGDYETLFGWDRVCEYAFLDDLCVALWSRVLDHIEVFDVSHVGHDVLGRLFERLIDPHERYEWGQHYTSSDIADLILSFVIPDGKGALLDPACGGGTFLVRAYARKKVFEPERSHQDRLTELFGVDVSRFAATIATVNLAIRQLDFADNYPRIAARSFFKVNVGSDVISIPGPHLVKLGERESVPVAFGGVRAVVGNPPYVRLHQLGSERQREAAAVLGARNRIPTPPRLSKLANFHVYFWLHGAQFLERGGHLALLTAGEWMDADYGVALQQWLLENFCIEAFIESGKEAWFSEARVGTVVTIARQCSDENERATNRVRFVLLRKRLRDLFGVATSERQHFEQVDALRDRILRLEGMGESDDFDWSVVTQRNLWDLGTLESNGGVETRLREESASDQK